MGFAVGMPDLDSLSLVKTTAKAMMTARRTNAATTATMISPFLDLKQTLSVVT